MNLIKIIVASLATLTASSLTFAAGQSSTNFVMKLDALNNGAGQMTSANFNLSSSVGDAATTGNITSVSFVLSSGFRGQVSVSSAVLNLLSVVSRKLHGATPFEITIAHTVPITGLITVEPRTIGTTGHTIVFRFDNTVNSVAAVTAMDAMAAGVGNATVTSTGSEATVTLVNVPDNKRLTVTLTGINGAGTASASMGFLVGDVNNTRSVNPSDVSTVKARSGQTATALNFRFDLNATGAISASDISAVKARSGLPLP